MSLAKNSAERFVAGLIRFLRTHKRVITFLAGAWLLFFAFFLIPNRGEGMFFFLLFSVLFLLLIGSQIFWLSRLGDLGKRLIRHPGWRRALGAIGLLVYFGVFAFNLLVDSGMDSGVSPRFALEAPFAIWFVGSTFGFVIAGLLGAVDFLARAIGRALRKSTNLPAAELRSPGRRRFLEQTALSLSVAPFVAGAYGLFYGRLNLEITRQRIGLRRLPQAFEGFRIVQLSDLHISPYMSAEQIGRYVAIANQLKGDLVVLTGDFITYDATAQEAVVGALSPLKAPFGVFGCLGNHEYLTETEESITRLFAKEHIRILRQERERIQSHGETLNLIGIDYQQARFSRDHGGHEVERYMEGSEKLVMQGTVNILLNHNPNAFDRAAELGIDLMLAGHTHGGQLSLEMVHPDLCFSRLVTPYVRGWYEKAGSQLYVNRGIGTLSLPIRFGARPEITVFELTRRA